MPEINIRSGQKPPSRSLGADELAKTEMSMRRFLNKQQADAVTAAEKDWVEKFLKPQQRQAKALGEAVFKQRERQEREQLAAEAKQNKEKQTATRRMESERVRTEKEDRANQRRVMNTMMSEAAREDRKRETKKNQDARYNYAEASSENKRIDTDRRRMDRERLQSEKAAARAAAAAAPIGFMRGAAMGGGGAALLGAFTGGAAPTRIMGAAAGTMAGGIGGMLGASEGAAGIYGAIAEAMVKIMFEPAAIANAITKPYQDYRLSAMSLSRAGLNPGEGAYREFFSGMPGEVNKKLGAVGLGPQDAVQLLQSLGVVPTGNLTDIATTTRAYSMSSAFTGMKAGTTEGIVGQGMAQGNIGNQGQGLNGYLERFSRIMEEATARGMDRSRLLDSMQQSMDIVAKSGASGVSQEAVAGMMFKFMGVGDRTGASAAGVMGDIENTMGNITGNRLSSAMLMSQMPKFGNLKTVKDVQALVGPQAWAAAGATPEGARMRDQNAANAAAAAQQGRMATAMQYSMEIMKADPSRLNTVLGPAVMQAAGGNPVLYAPLLQQAFGTTFTGATQLVGTPGGVSASFGGGGGRGGPGSGISAAQVGGLTGRGAPANMMAFDSSISDVSYIARLTGMGLSRDAATALLAGAKASNTNPFMMAALGNAESSNNPNQGWNNGPDHISYGPMQVNQFAHPELGMKTGAAGYASGGMVFQQALRNSHGNVEEALRSYRGVDDPTWTKKVNQFYQSGMGGGYAGGSNVAGFDQGILQSQANEQQQSIQTASMFYGLIPAANALATAFTSLAETVTTTNKALTLGPGGQPMRARPNGVATSNHGGP